MDVIHVIRINVHADAIETHQAVMSYKILVQVERTFRCLKFDVKLRLIYVFCETSVQGHAFLCTLVYYVEWQLRQKLALDSNPAYRFTLYTEPTQMQEYAVELLDVNPRKSVPMNLTDFFYQAVTIQIIGPEDYEVQANSLG